MTAALLQRYSHYGVDFKIYKKDCIPIYALDAQRSTGKCIFGGGLLLSDCAAAERAAAIKWELSARECAIVEYLNSHEN